MIDLIERIGPYLGIAAFLGLAVLAFLIFQQAREVRRLREWAGRAPERADAANEAESAVAEARGDEPEEHEAQEAPPEVPGRTATALAAVKERFAKIYATLDRRSPVDPRYFLVVIAAGIVAAGVLTSGFGLFGDDGDAPAEEQTKKGSGKEEKVDVTVLNATQDDSGPVPVAGVQGLADDIAKEVVKPAGFGVGEKTDAPAGFTESTIMFEDGEEEAAQELADAVADQLGETETQPITSDIADVAGGAPLVLVVGQDDAEALE